MGDRCYLTFTLTGHIPSMEALEAIAEAIDGENLKPSDYLENARDTIVDVLLWPERQGGIEFVCEECNHADVSGAEAACQEYGVAYEIDHGAGGDYPAGHSAYAPEFGHHSEASDGSGAVIPLYELEALLNAPEPLDAIRKRIEAAALAAGRGQPDKITAAPEVIAALIAERDEDAVRPTPEQRYPQADWQAEVSAGDTVRGYADWVAAKAEEESH